LTPPQHIITLVSDIKNKESIVHSLPLSAIEGKYEILEKLREGGMGAIYKVRHRLLHEIRVIKVMRPQLADDRVLRGRDRFVREARIAVKLKHPNIAQMYDFSLDREGNGYIVMEYIDGVTLKQLVTRGERPSLALTTEIAIQALAAIDHLHQHGFVHRDIAPDNLMVTLDHTGSLQVKLIDLGIARLVGDGDGMTQTGEFLGKYKYAAPELFEDDVATIDQRSDLYSLGVVLYELLTGVYPIRGKEIPSVIAGHLLRPVRSFDQTDPAGHIPESMRETVLRALAKRPQGRFGSAREMRAALEQLRVSPIYELQPHESRRLVTAAIAANDQSSSPLGTTQRRLDSRFPVDLPTEHDRSWPTLHGPAPVPEDDEDKTRPNLTLLVPDDETVRMRIDTVSELPSSAGTAAPAPRAASNSVVQEKDIARQKTARRETTQPGTATFVKRPLALLLSIAVLLGICVLIGIVWLTRAPGTETSFLSVTSVVVENAEDLVDIGDLTPPPAPLLATVVLALDRMAEGDYEGARTALVELSKQDELGLLDAESCEAYRAATETLLLLRNEQQLTQLQSAVAAGNHTALRSTIRSMTPEETARLVDRVSRGRRPSRPQEATRLLGLYANGLESADALIVLEAATELERRFRGLARALGTSARAIAAAETEADRLLENREIDRAELIVNAVASMRPQRQGITERLKALRTVENSDARLEDALLAAEYQSLQGYPHLGLSMLEELQPHQEREPRVVALRTRFKAQLAELDREVPVLRLRPGTELLFPRREEVILELQASDDYGVMSVLVELELGETGERMTLVGKPTTADIYRVVISPDLHAGQKILLWATASDRSGQIGQLASAESPLELKPRRWFRR
jgi:serine/threonine protein kinase